MLRCGLWFSVGKKCSSGARMSLIHSSRSWASRLVRASLTKARLNAACVEPLAMRNLCGASDLSCDVRQFSLRQTNIVQTIGRLVNQRETQQDILCIHKMSVPTSSLILGFMTNVTDIWQRTKQRSFTAYLDHIILSFPHLFNGLNVDLNNTTMSTQSKNYNTGQMGHYQG